MTHDQDVTFVRRKFTITEDLDDVLQNLAAQHYQGNISLCLRAAIEDHRTTLRGNDDLKLHQLTSQIDQLHKQQDDIKSVIESLHEIETQREEPSQHAPDGLDLTEDMQAVYDALAAADNGLRLDDLTDQLNLPVARIQPALGDLIDQALVVATSEQPERFYLTGTEP